MKWNMTLLFIGIPGQIGRGTPMAGVGGTAGQGGTGKTASLYLSYHLLSGARLAKLTKRVLCFDFD